MEFFDESGKILPECEDLYNFIQQYFEGQTVTDTILGFWEYIPYKAKVQMLTYWAECHLEDIHTEDKYISQQIEEAKKTLGMLKALQP